MIELTFHNRGKVSDIVYRYRDIMKLKQVSNSHRNSFFDNGGNNLLFFVDDTKFCHLTRAFVNELSNFFSLKQSDSIYVLFMWLMNTHNISVRDYAINMV